MAERIDILESDKGLEVQVTFLYTADERKVEHTIRGIHAGLHHDWLNLKDFHYEDEIMDYKLQRGIKAELDYMNGLGPAISASKDEVKLGIHLETITSYKILK
ncbi:hypothetical protein GOV11_05065 [Candidatus Woesearchaeota archaeon]|nr:hypothetical protein [Candidatus Woesearchaeota archaeon]